VKAESEVVKMPKSRCPKCKKVLEKVLSSFECLSAWSKDEQLYMPQQKCKLVKRCPECGSVARDQPKRIARARRAG
jgi:uncharacterized protein with PIN domain